MTRKDFQLVAEILGESLAEIHSLAGFVCDDMIDIASRKLATTNHAFNPVRFRDAVMTAYQDGMR